MERVSEKTAIKPPIRQPMCDDDILRLLADHQGHTIPEMAAHFRVTQTTIRSRLNRLMLKQSVTRKCTNEQTRGRGRPKHLYFITSQSADQGTT
ncbi:MAG: DeoR family transcriptional regulator [Planctomycetota bacterium]